MKISRATSPRPTSSGELPAAGCWSLPAGGSRGPWRSWAPGADSPRSPWVLPPAATGAGAETVHDRVQAQSSRYLLAAILLLKLQELDGTHRAPSDPHAAIHRQGLPGTIVLDCVGLLEEQVSYRDVRGGKRASTKAPARPTLDATITRHSCLALFPFRRHTCGLGGLFARCCEGPPLRQWQVLIRCSHPS